MSQKCPKLVRRGWKHNFRTFFRQFLPIWSMLLFGDPVTMQRSPVTTEDFVWPVSSALNSFKDRSEERGYGKWGENLSRNGGMVVSATFHRRRVGTLAHASLRPSPLRSPPPNFLSLGACALTTMFLDYKICTFKILLSWRFPWNDFPLSLQGPQRETA